MIKSRVLGSIAMAVCCFTAVIAPLVFLLPFAFSSGVTFMVLVLIPLALLEYVLFPVLVLGLMIVLALCPKPFQRRVLGWLDQRAAKEPPNPYLQKLDEFEARLKAIAAQVRANG